MRFTRAESAAIADDLARLQSENVKLREALELARRWIDPNGDPVADSSREVLVVIDAALSVTRPECQTP